MHIVMAFVKLFVYLAVFLSWLHSRYRKKHPFPVKISLSLTPPAKSPAPERQLCLSIRNTGKMEARIIDSGLLTQAEIRHSVSELVPGMTAAQLSRNLEPGVRIFYLLSNDDVIRLATQSVYACTADGKMFTAKVRLPKSRAR